MWFVLTERLKSEKKAIFVYYPRIGHLAPNIGRYSLKSAISVLNRLFSITSPFSLTSDVPELEIQPTITSWFSEVSEKDYVRCSIRALDQGSKSRKIVHYINFRIFRKFEFSTTRKITSERLLCILIYILTNLYQYRIQRKKCTI